MTSRTSATRISRRSFNVGAAAVGAIAATGVAPAVIGAQDQVEIKLAHPSVNDEWDANLEALVNQFMEANPAIKVTVEHRPGEEYWDKLQTEYAGGQAPDVTSINMDWTVPGASRGMFVDLNPLFERDNVDLSDLWYDMEPEWGYEGGMYGGILYGGGQNLYVNKDLLDAAGVAMPTAEWTWDDLLEAGKALTDEGTQQFGINFSPISPPYWSSSFIHGAGGTVLNDARDECTLNTPEAREGLQWIVDLIHTHKVMPIPPIVGSDEGLENPFLTGKVAFFFGGGWEEGAIRAAGFNWDFAPMPAHPTTGTKSVQLGSNAWSLMSTSSHQDESWELIKYLSGPEGARAMMSYGIPGYTSIVESQEFRDIHAPQDIMIPVSDFMEYGHDYYPTPDAGEWWDAVEAELGPMWTGEDDVENSTQRATDRVNEIFSQRTF
jgi:multiple sugar transport system substrate-binding protein